MHDSTGMLHTLLIQWSHGATRTKEHLMPKLGSQQQGSKNFHKKRNSDGCLPRFIETDDSSGHINQLANYATDKNID